MSPASINDLARMSLNTAIIRGKTSKDLSHDGTFFGILEDAKRVPRCKRVREIKAPSRVHRSTGRVGRYSHLLPHRTPPPWGGCREDSDREN